MSAKFWFIVFQLVAASIGLLAIAGVVLGNMMHPSDSRISAAEMWGALTIVAVTIAVVIAAGGGMRFARPGWIACAVVTTLLAGAAPVIVNAIVSWQSVRHRQADSAAEDARAINAIVTRGQDVEARISARRPYSAAESLAFVEAVAYVDLSYRGLPDRSGDMRALLKRALEANILDPNILVKGPRPIDVDLEPLFVHYYRATIRPFPANWIKLRDWETLKLLVASGADMTVAGAEPLADDLRKPIAPNASGQFQLK